MNLVKTTLDLPDELLKDAEASAASRGETLRDYVAAALESRLRDEKGRNDLQGWRSVFGAATTEEVAEVDAIIAHDLETIVPDDWR